MSNHCSDVNVLSPGGLKSLSISPNGKPTASACRPSMTTKTRALSGCRAKSRRVLKVTKTSNTGKRH